MNRRKKGIVLSLVIIMIIVTMEVEGITLGDIETKIEKEIVFKKKIELKNGLDTGSMAIDEEKELLFISSGGIKVYNISNPMKMKNVHNDSIEANGGMKYYKGYLFSMEDNYSKVRVNVHKVSKKGKLTLVDSKDVGELIEKIYIIDNETMITTGVYMRVWDISNRENITCTQKIDMEEFFLGIPPYEPIEIAGIVKHPEEKMLLIAAYYSTRAKICMVDYTDKTNITKVEFNKESFPIDTAVNSGYKNGMIMSGKYPIIMSNNNFIEVWNWTNTESPTYINETRISQKGIHTNVPRITRINSSEMLIYRRNAGIVDISKPEKVTYITNHTTETYIFSYEEPVIHKEYIICTDGIIRSQVDYYDGHLNVYKIEEIISDEKKGKAKIIIPTVIGSIAVAGITTYGIIKKRKR